MRDYSMEGKIREIRDGSRSCFIIPATAGNSGRLSLEATLPTLFSSTTLRAICLALLLLTAAACTKLDPGPAQDPGQAATLPAHDPGQALRLAPTTIAPTFAPTQTSTIAPSTTPTSTQTPTPSPLPTEINTPESSQDPSQSATLRSLQGSGQAYAILRGEVLELSNCRYGPGAMYLYKYALIPGSNLEVFGRIESGNWILVRAIGGTNPCWVKASLMELTGDVMSLEPVYLPLPQSPYYGPLGGVSASRDGDQVTVSWNAIQLRAGDDTASPIHLVEAWVCQGGDLAFIPTGTDLSSVVLEDEAGCSEPSHGRVYGVEKHGYTHPVEIPWPTRP